MSRDHVSIQIGVPFTSTFTATNHRKTDTVVGYREYGLNLFKSELCFVSIKLVRFVIPHHNNDKIHPLVVMGDSISFEGSVQGNPGNQPGIQAYLPFSLLIRMKQVAGTNLNSYLDLALYMKVNNRIYQWLNDKINPIRPQYMNLSRARLRPGSSRRSVVFWPTDSLDWLNQTQFLLYPTEVSDAKTNTLFG